MPIIRSVDRQGRYGVTHELVTDQLRRRLDVDPQPSQLWRALPSGLARLEAFGQANGARTGAEMRARITRLRRIDPGSREDFVIGSHILTQPFFLDRADWISVPSWHGRSFEGRPTKRFGTLGIGVAQKGRVPSASLRQVSSRSDSG